MSSLRNKIDRSRTSKKKPQPDPVHKEEEESDKAAEEEKSEHEPEEDYEASEDEGKQKGGKKKVASSKKSPKKSPNKKASPKQKVAAAANVEEDDYVEPSSSEEEEPDQKDDEDYQEESENEEESFDDEDDDDDEDYERKSKKRKAPARKKKAATSKKRKPPAKKTRVSGRARSKPAQYASDESSSHDDGGGEDSDDDGDAYNEKPAARSTSRRRDSDGSRRSSRRSQRKGISSYKVDGSSEEDNNDSENDNASYSHNVSSDHDLSRRLPARASAASATAKINQLRYKEDKEAEEEEDGDDDVPIASSGRSSSARKNRKIDEDEEEFQLDEEQEEEQDKEDDKLDEEARSSGNESFLEGVHSVPSDNQAIGNVFSIDFGDDEQSDNENQPDKAKTPERGDIKRKAAAVPYHSNSDDDPEIEPTPTKARLSQEERTKTPSRHSKSVPPRLPECPSTNDEILCTLLPKIHVCCLSPDGQSRHCFALETLHKIATTSSHPQYRTNLSDQQQLTFLQPPHFRSAMSADLEDQIASRFGRQALNLHGDFYKRNRSASASARLSTTDDDDEENGNYQVNFTSAHTDTDGFMDSWREYQLRNMGSQDVYPCPLCYTVAHHRLEEGEAKPIQLPQEFSNDPMSVLASPDNEDFDIAAAFCFKRISQVKQHLRDDHGCKTARIDSEVFMRYKVRTPDGLLQRYLAKSRTYGTTKQGDMRRYWYDGNSEQYIYLLYQMQQLQHYRDSRGRSNNQGSGDDDEAHEDNNPLAKAEDYFQSMQDQVEELWDTIVSPFSLSKADMKDFLNDDDDDEEEVEDALPRHVFNREQAASTRKDDEALAARYNMMAEEERSSGDESSRYSDEDHVHLPQAPKEFESEEEDDWVTGIRSKKRRTSLETPAKANGSTGPKAKGSGRRRISGVKQRKSKDSDSDASVAQAMEEKESEKKLPPSSSSKRAILEDSDSD